MNGLRNGLVMLGLLLAMASSVAAQPVAGIIPAVQPDSGAPSAVVQVGGGPVAGSGSGEPVIAAATAAEVLKVSMLEPPVAAVLSPDERQLELRKADFHKFAEVKLRDMNRNHLLSRERMRIEKLANGSYKASYHQIDDASMSYQVSRSPTKGAQYVAVLSYKERVYSAACGNPAECRQGEFAPVEVIPNRHIFVFNNGAWQ